MKCILEKIIFGRLRRSLVNKLLTSLDFTRGPEMKNRFMLAPLTNSQSHEDGIMSDEEFHWLTMRAKGGFGLTMTCASHIQAIGKGFPGQMGVFSDDHLEGLSRLAKEINDHDSISIVQLHHAGMRSPKELIGEDPVCPSDNEEFSARALTLDEVKILRDDFISGAVRSEKAGFHGVELHGAHGYIICQFLSDEVNLRDDEYGGDLQGRASLLNEIIDGIRSECSKDFMLGVRLSSERFGIKLSESKQLAQELMVSGKLDFLDMSLWDCFKEPQQEEFKGKTLLQHFSELDKGDTRLGVAGNIRTPQDATRAMEADIDWIMLGRAAILNHNFPVLYSENPEFETPTIPVTADYLAREGLSPKFISYMSNWGFIEGYDDKMKEALKKA